MPLMWANQFFLQDAPAYNTWQSSSSVAKDDYGPRVMLYHIERGAYLAAILRKQTEKTENAYIIYKFCWLAGYICYYGIDLNLL